MTNFPFYQHHIVKVIFQKEVTLNEELMNQISDSLIKDLKLNVVSQTKYEFTNDGLTKVWILSQSHLVIHSWPENDALHIDLMTCNPSTFIKEKMKNCFSSFLVKEISIIKLDY